MVQQHGADLAADHVGVVVGESDLLPERGFCLFRQRREGRDRGIHLLRQTADREEERCSGHRIGVHRQAVEFRIEALGGTVAAGAIARGLLVEFCLQERQIPGGVFGDRVVDDRLDARRKSVLHTVGNVRAEPRGRQHG